MKYKALGHIQHDGVHYYTGDEIELSSEEAKPLLEAKAVERFHKPFAGEQAASHGDSEGGEV